MGLVPTYRKLQSLNATRAGPPTIQAQLTALINPNPNPNLLFGLFGTLHNCKIGSVQVNDEHTNDGAYLRGIAPLRAKPTQPSLAPEKGVPVSASGADNYPGITWTLTYISGGTFTASGEHARV